MPTGFEKIRVLLEVRYEEREVGGPPVGGKVWWDDVYMGD